MTLKTPEEVQILCYSGAVVVNFQHIEFISQSFVSTLNMFFIVQKETKISLQKHMAKLHKMKSGGILYKFPF